MERLGARGTAAGCRARRGLGGGAAMEPGGIEEGRGEAMRKAMMIIMLSVVPALSGASWRAECRGVPQQPKDRRLPLPPSTFELRSRQALVSSLGQSAEAPCSAGRCGSGGATSSRQADLLCGPARRHVYDHSER
jgi:hypothetical protein